MTAACAASEVAALCRDPYSLDDADTLRVLSLCSEMDQGYADGQDKASPGEPPPTGKDGKPGEPLPFEEYIEPATLALDVLELLEEQLFLHPESEPPPLFPLLDPTGELGILQLIASCGLRPLDVWPVCQQNELAQAVCWRDVRFVPTYFEELFLPLGAQVALRNLTEPGALKERYGEGGE